MFTKSQIDWWISLYNRYSDNQQSMSLTPSDLSIKHKLIEAKHYIDRWDNVTTDYIIHNNHLDSLLSQLGNSVDHSYHDPVHLWDKWIKYNNNILENNLDPYNKLSLEEQQSSIFLPSYIDLLRELSEFSAEPIRIWSLYGANIHISTHVPENIGMALCLDNHSLDFKDFSKKCIALFYI